MNKTRNQAGNIKNMIPSFHKQSSVVHRKSEKEKIITKSFKQQINKIKQQIIEQKIKKDKTKTMPYHKDVEETTDDIYRIAGIRQNFNGQ